MNLVIDVGNTLVKVAVFQNTEVLEVTAFKDQFFFQEVEGFFQSYPEIDQIILASVKIYPSSWNAFLEEKAQLFILDADTKVPFINKYSSPKTLGLDRIALAAAAVTQYANKNVLVIDAGTCVTYDFIDENACYLGGAISPGLRMRYQALHNFTSKLPLLEPTGDNDIPLIGKNTMSSIQVGVVWGISMEMDGFIDEYSKSYKDLTVILTGGDSHLLSKRVKNGIFAPSNFLLKGLNSILEFNKN